LHEDTEEHTTPQPTDEASEAPIDEATEVADVETPEAAPEEAAEPPEEVAEPPEEAAETPADAAPTPSPAADFRVRADALRAECARLSVPGDDEMLLPVEAASVGLILAELAEAVTAGTAWEDRLKALAAFLAWVAETDGAPEPRVLCSVVETPKDGADVQLQQECWFPSGVAAPPDRIRIPPKFASLGGRAHRMRRRDLVLISPDAIDDDGTLTGPPERRPSGRKGFEDIIWDQSWPTHDLACAHLKPSPGMAGWIYVHNKEENFVEGPYRRLRRGGMNPADKGNLVARLDLSTFTGLLGISHRFDGASPPRALTWRPSSIEALLGQPGVTTMDAGGDDDFRQWLEKLVGIPAELHDALEAGLKTMEELAAGESLDASRAKIRAQRLAGWVAHSELLASWRAAAVAEWVESETGKSAIADGLGEAIQLAVKEGIEDRAEAIRAGLLEEEAALAEARRLTDEARGGRDAEFAEHEARLASLREQIEAADALRHDAKWKLTQSIVLDGVARTVSDAPLPSRSAARTSTSSIADLTDSLGAITPDDPALARGLAAALVADRLVLVADEGRRDYLVSGVLNVLGHGGESSRSLVLRARPDWTDDAALFGWWDARGSCWEAGSEGLLEHLLAAQNDRAGLYTTTVERFGAARPEAWLGRLLGGAHRIGLYGDHLVCRNGRRYPSTVDVGDNVRVVGRLESSTGPHRPSRGLLEQSWVVRASSAVAVAGETAVVDWAAVQSDMERRFSDRVGAPGLGDLVTLMDASPAGGPSAATRVAVDRFLVAAAPLMEPAEAADCAVAWRVLPSLSVEGEAGRALLDGIADLAGVQGWPRTSALVASIRAAGERTGGFFEGLALRWD
jgi:hypothetical protein